MTICRNIQNNAIYKHVEGNRFVNVVTGEEGVVDDETAKRILKINVPATIICCEYPMVEELIKRLGLKFNK